MIEYSCFVRNGKGAKCRICNIPLEKGDPYVHLRINQFARPYFHAKCMIKAGHTAEAEVANIEKIKEKHEAEKAVRKASLREAQNPILFRKQIIRNALKTQGVNIQSLPISQIGNRYTRQSNKARGIECVLRVVNSVEVAFMNEGLMRIDGCLRNQSNRVPIISQARYRGVASTPSTEIHLADPESIEKLGKALLSCDYRGHIKARQKEV